MDHDLVDAATEALQAQERLQIQLRAKRDSPHGKKVYQQACTVLDSLRDIKSELEHTAMTFEPVNVKDAVLAEMRNLVLMNVPGTMNTDTKERLSSLVNEAFDGSCREVVFGAFFTCPWYWATQDDRGLQAKHNTVFVVYVNKDEQFFSPVNPHQKEKDSEVIDKGWFYATEAFHFANYILKGKARFIESLFLPETAVFLSTDRWKTLKSDALFDSCLGMRGFLEQCRGQAVGAVGKKSKSTGRMKINDGATLHEFCESFRLLHHASRSMTGQGLHLDALQTLDLPDDISAQALELLKQSYQADMCDKPKLFDVLMEWRREVDKLMTGRKFTPPGSVQDKLGTWLYEIRTRGGAVIPKALQANPDQKAVLGELMSKIGGPVVKMNPENIIMIVQAGSVLYGLNTPDSDVDYLVIYADPIQKVLGACTRAVESVESRGPEKSFEYGAYEARLFCEMLWKGSVVILELLFADKVEYSSEMWQLLVANKHLVLTERAILQYFGLIKNNLSDIEHKRYIGTPRERKLFYQILHKLYCLEFFLKGECPQIRCEGETRDFIMRIRKGPLEGEITREKLYELCLTKTNDLRKRLSERKKRLPENINFFFLTKWLMKVRGWDIDETDLSDKNLVSNS